MERSKQIEKNLKEDGLQAAKDIKLLLLGKVLRLFWPNAGRCFGRAWMLRAAAGKHGGCGQPQPGFAPSSHFCILSLHLRCIIPSSLYRHTLLQRNVLEGFLISDPMICIQ